MTRSALAPCLLAAWMCLAATPAAAGDIVRHCDGRYSMIATLVDGDPPSDLAWSFGEYSGEGHCGSTVRNRCRERARDKLRTCFSEHWKVRWDRVRPEACTEPAGVSKYALTDIKTAMEKEVCCTERALAHDEIIVNLYGVTWGGEGCGGDASPRLLLTQDELKRSWLVQADYEMDCSELRKTLCREYLPKRTSP